MATSGQPDAVINAPHMERIIAAVIDIIIVTGLFLFPRVGWMIGIIYHLTKDSLPFLKGQSFGKHLMRIKVITRPDNRSLVRHPEKSVIRGLVLLIPGLNLVDIWYFFTKGSRLADYWAQTSVIYTSDENPESEDSSL
ncbi:RDD family protein [Alkalitalea saponilacus]|uniref:RDD family protein n=1 Tax=Alkalitalea saponilacus TaxID=889453 RepID=A0A1T5HT72_9BACT|nr:hypothetical protein [Alkalitalea saponilacus]ASB48509.1 hypothetical protein CDL62_04840 [Alkalitalea saponilacus]SKC23867.1 RDD family protein [Alkalitalea saponilacus]